jgi:ubiquinol-cytochrome c reductase cytochrome b subunit
MAEFKVAPADAPLGVKLMTWVDNRFPATKLYKEHLSEYYAPKNFNFWYFFGSLALLVLVIQIVTGIFLVMHYKPDASLNGGRAGGLRLGRVHHARCALGLADPLHALHRRLGVLRRGVPAHVPRPAVRFLPQAARTGLDLRLRDLPGLMAEAFMGYLLPWGQMSFWGAQVIVNLFSAIPFVGPDLSLLIRGDYVVGDATLNRFFSFHVIAVPLVLLGLVVAHIIALHEVGSNNPDGVEIKAKKDEQGRPLDGIPFHPYYTVHDILGVSGFLMVFCAIMFFAPNWAATSWSTTTSSRPTR